MKRISRGLMVASFALTAISCSEPLTTRETGAAVGTGEPQWAELSGRWSVIPALAPRWVVCLAWGRER